MGLKIAGTGRHLPEYIATNQDFEAFLDTSDEWITARTGMKERRIALDTPVWRMGELAAREAIGAADISPEEIDLVVCTTVTADFRYPSTACIIQGAVGAKNAFAMDVSAACTGSVYAMDLARRYLSTGDVKTVLLVGAEALSQVADYTDRGTCVLFGDGAGAMVLRESPGLYAAALFSDPEGARHLYCKLPRRQLPFAGGRQEPAPEPFAVERELTVMNGREVYKFATRAMPAAIRAACQKAGIEVSDLDMVIPHQANLRIIETAIKNLGISDQRVYVNIHKYGNTSSASASICLDECIREGRLHRGDKLCLVGFGAGLTYGAVVMEY